MIKVDISRVSKNCNCSNFRNFKILFNVVKNRKRFILSEQEMSQTLN